MKRKIAIVVCLIGIAIGSIKLLNLKAKEYKTFDEFFTEYSEVENNPDELYNFIESISDADWSHILENESFENDVLIPNFKKYKDSEDWKYVAVVLALIVKDKKKSLFDEALEKINKTDPSFGENFKKTIDELLKKQEEEKRSEEEEVAAQAPALPEVAAKAIDNLAQAFVLMKQEDKKNPEIKLGQYVGEGGRKALTELEGKSVKRPPVKKPKTKIEEIKKL